VIFSIQPSSCLPRGIQSSLTVLFAVVFVFFCGTFAQAGWLVDTQKFHVSAHGQLSCQDCHTDIIERTLHPDPVLVNKQQTDVFDPEQCMECHDNVSEELENNQHGGEAINPSQSYENCLKCHDPHQTLLAADGAGSVDPEKPLAQQCGSCHEQQTALPAFTEEDETCLTCHRLMGADDPEVAGKNRQRCFHCHADTGTESQKITGRAMALVIPEDYSKTPHADLACIECHVEAASFPHGAQQMTDCGECHLPHQESIAHDVHATVACQACHLQDVTPVREANGARIVWEKERHLNTPLKIHEMVPYDDETACQRCHTGGNSVGASAMVLPSKSVICMPCHTATLSFGDTITAGSLILFLMGLGMSLLLMLSVSTGKGVGAGLTNKNHGSEPQVSKRQPIRNRVRMIHEIVLNVIFQKRLFERSPYRWAIHGLLFFPMALRFLWGIVAWGGSLWRPQWPWVWQLLDKNNGGTALFFDVTGIMILAGVILALVRHLSTSSRRIEGLPRRSRVALVLLGSIVLAGFILEGMRIAMTGATGSASYAFVGFGISRLFHNPELLSDVYGYGWYVHAALTGAFIVFLPFSRLLHIILSPVVFTLNAISRHE
jgi:nitrate reductase gamma subunit